MCVCVCVCVRARVHAKIGLIFTFNVFNIVQNKLAPRRPGTRQGMAVTSPKRAIIDVHSIVSGQNYDILTSIFAQ